MDRKDCFVYDVMGPFNYRQASAEYATLRAEKKIAIITMMVVDEEGRVM